MRGESRMTTRNLAGAGRWMVMPFKEMGKMEEVIWERGDSGVLFQTSELSCVRTTKNSQGQQILLQPGFVVTLMRRART